MKVLRNIILLVVGIIGNDSNVFAYFIHSYIYYQFSGWNKSDFNITADTSITASWNTVSSGDGLNFID